MQFAAREIKKRDMGNGGIGGYSIPRIEKVSEEIVAEPLQIPEVLAESEPIKIEPQKEKMEDTKLIEQSQALPIIEAPVQAETAIEPIKETVVEKIEDEIQEEIVEVVEEVKKWWGQTVFENKRERFGLMLIVLGILFISIVSASHLAIFFAVGNNIYESWLAAFAFEILSFGTIGALVLLPQIKKWALYSSLFLLYVLQIFGNCYASFAYIEPQNAIHFFDFFGLNVSEIYGKRIAAILLSAILPTVSFVFTQLIKKYFVPKIKK